MYGSGDRGGFRRRGRFGGGGGFSNAPKPVSVGEVVEVTIEATGSRGDGIAKKDGFVIFVKGASQGEKVKVKITSVGRSSANAEVVREGGSEAGESSPEPSSGEPAPEEPAVAEESEETDIQ